MAVTPASVIAVNVLAMFKGSELPFCAILVGWASDRYPPDTLGAALAGVGSLTGPAGEHPVTSEGFTRRVPGGAIHLEGAYPLRDVPQQDSFAAHARVSLLANEDTADQLIQ